MQFLVVRARIDVERIELRMQVSAHAVGADQHDGVNGIARCLENLGLVDRTALGFGLRLDLVADDLLDLRPVAVHGGDEIAVRRDRPVGLLPGRAARALLDRLPVVLQCREERLPLGIDRSGVLLEARIEILDIGRVRPV